MTTIDHNEIQQWAEKYHGKPEIITDPAGEKGLRIDFPGKRDDMYLSQESFPNEISWNDFFDLFEELQLAFIFDEPTNESDPSLSYRFIRRENASL